MARLVALGLLALVACSDGVPDDGAQSGSRLKIVDWVFDDGTRQWKGFHDANRQEGCQALLWDDGRYYCTPGIPVQYADPGCTQPIIVGAAALGYERPYNPCGNTTTHVFEVGNQRALPRNYYAQDGMGRCIPQTADQTQTYFSIGAELPRSELVELAVTAPSGTGRVQTRFLTSSDGVRFPWSLHDQELGLDCIATSYYDGQESVSCEPVAAQAMYSRDATCSVPVLGVELSCPQPTIAATRPTSACPTDAGQYLRLDPTPALSPLFETKGSTCSRAAPAAATNYFTATSRVDLVTLDRKPAVVSEHRLQHIYVTGPNGVRLRDVPLYDSYTGAECSPVIRNDGQVACFSQGGPVLTGQPLFTDAGCTTAIDIVEFPTGPAGCAPPPSPRVVTVITPFDAQSFDSLQEHVVGAAYSDPLWGIQGLTGTCLPVPSANTEFFLLGPPVPWDDLEHGTIEIQH